MIVSKRSQLNLAATLHIDWSLVPIIEGSEKGSHPSKALLVHGIAETATSNRTDLSPLPPTYIHTTDRIRLSNAMRLVESTHIHPLNVLHLSIMYLSLLIYEEYLITSLIRKGRVRPYLADI